MEYKFDKEQITAIVNLLGKSWWPKWYDESYLPYLTSDENCKTLEEIEQELSDKLNS